MQQTTHQTPPATDPDSLRVLGGTIAATCAGFNLRRASRAVTQHFDHALAPAGLRTTQFTLLGALALGGPCDINQLAQALVMDRTTLTRNLKLLRDSGLVWAARSRAGRKIRFELTSAGRETLARAVPYWREAQDGIVTAFGTELWPGLVAELYRLVSGTLALDSLGGSNGSATALDSAVTLHQVTANGHQATTNGIAGPSGHDHTADQNV